MDELEDVIKNMTTVIEKLTDGVKELIDKMREQRDGAEELTDTIKELIDKIKEQKDETGGLTDMIQNQIRLTQYQILQLSEFYKAVEPLKTYARIWADQYQKDKGIKTITVEDVETTSNAIDPTIAEGLKKLDKEET